jgi:hypothetical protein
MRPHSLPACEHGHPGVEALEVISTVGHRHANGAGQVRDLAHLAAVQVLNAVLEIPPARRLALVCELEPIGFIERVDYD